MMLIPCLWGALLLQGITSLIVLQRGPRLARPLLLVLLAGILWTGCALRLLDHPLPAPTMLWMSRGALISIALCCAGLFWLTTRWPARMPWGQELALAWGVLMGLCITLSASPWAVTLGQTVDRQPKVLNGPIAVLVTILLPVTVLIGTLQLGYIGAHLVGKQRLHARYLLTSYGILFAGLCLDLLFPPRTFLPFLRWSPLALALAGSLAAYPLAFLHPVPLPNLLRRSLCALVTIGVLGGGIAMLAPRLGSVLLHALHIPFQQTMLLLGMAMALMMHPLYRGVCWIYQRYFRCSYDERQLLTDLGATLRTAVRTEAVVASVCTTIRRSLRPHPFAVLLARPDGSWHWAWDNPCDATLVQSAVDLRAYPNQLTTLCEQVLIDDLHRLTPYASTGDWLGRAGFSLVQPILAGTTCYGMLLLGQKADRERYADDDEAFITRIAHHAALAFENAWQYEALCTLNASLEARVSERTQELHAAVAQLKADDEAKDRFLALLSHELLTPVTSILGWTSLANDQENPPRTRTALTVIERNIRRQKRLVDDLLDASRIIHGKLAVEQEPLDLWEIVVAVVEGMHPMADEKGLSLTLDSPANPLPIIGDAVRLQQVISNLLTNAIKFTPSGGVVTVTQASQPETVQVSVHDTGKGLSAEALGHIFDLFRQEETDQYTSGLGIGLALVKGIVTVHGGDVSAASDGPGHGSTFTITLPRHDTEPNA